jgi:hypothetical protein
MYKNNIGTNADRIWHLLSDKGALSVQELGKLTSCHESFIYLALGWLSREGEIRFFEKDGTLCAELAHSAMEMYY